MLDWKLAMEEERAVLKRIIALLFALADLAESASHRCLLVRRFVLWVLRPAEAVARDFVMGEHAPPASEPISLTGHGPDDAMRLAESFRDLACELEYQARWAFASEDNPEQANTVRFSAGRALDINNLLKSLRLAIATIACRAACATGPPDTS